MSYITLHENETLEEGIKSRTKTSTEPVECYKVIEECMTGSGRIEYRTMPMYAELSEDVINGKTPQHPTGKTSLKVEPDGRLPLTAGFIHAYKNYEDALSFMKKWCSFGYLESRPVIYRCVIPPEADYLETLHSHSKEDSPCVCYVTFNLMYCNPLTQKVAGKTMPYVKMEKPEVNKKKYGIVYNESDINGNTELPE